MGRGEDRGTVEGKPGRFLTKEYIDDIAFL